MPQLLEILRTRFGFPSFRPHQEAVCRATTEGKDVLLVMPTGAGKSLCYQLPGLARGGTTLVISPLVALIEDQVQKLKSQGLRAERIHSGRAREDSRQAARDYLYGNLDFLFIAPERLAVPGFPEMLKRRPPVLIAVDEAHCISHWGHDFRPDYRLVGERLKELRGAPVIALTATATPLVQDDIVKQLQLDDCGRFIQGFRRTNLGIEVAELNPSARTSAVLEILAGEGRLPAILYAPTRKRAEELAAAVSGGGFKASCYHAGLNASLRDQVQTRFLKSEIDVIVATVAFGMGIDKSNVRTVIHAALPGSLEGYYQEIGRAGRDGLPSRAVLLQGFIDRKTHEFFFDQDYPDVTLLRKIRREVVQACPGSLLPDERGATIQKDLLQARFNSTDPGTFEKALEKLWMHGGVEVDPDENIGPGRENWDRDYVDQSEHKRLQLRKMAEFAEAPGCRMLHLVRHFGDQIDGGAACGQCDRCRPDSKLAVLPERLMNEIERGLATGILASLAGRDAQAAGRLFEEASQGVPGAARGEFERVLKTLGLAGWVESLQESFEKDGKTIPFRRILLTREGKRATATALAKLTVADSAGETSGGRKKSKPKKKAPQPPRYPASPVRTTHYVSTREEDGEYRPQGGFEEERVSENPLMFENLREWRLAEARVKGIPAFRILSDRVLHAICEAMPTNPDQLMEVRGMGPKLVTQYGGEILKRIREA